MSVAIITDNDFDKTNGVTTTLEALLRHAPRDLRVRVYTASDLEIDEPQYLAIRSLSLPIPFYGDMRMYVPRVGRLRRELAADGVRLVHVTTPGPVGLAARYLGASEDLPLVGSFHTNLGDYTAILSGSPRLGRLMDAYMRWLYGRCQPVLVPSHDTLEHLVSKRWRRDRLALWPRGVDTILFSPARRSLELRQRWSVGERRPALLYVGRVSREKGLDVLEPLGALLHRYRASHRLIIVGDGPMTPELKERCPDAVFTGNLRHEDVAVVMASADVLVFPSETDTAGNVVLEAQASGLPVVVADGGGARENMRDEETGYVCRSRDAADFCRRIAELLYDADRRTQMSAAARRFAAGRSWTAALEPVFSAYRYQLARAALARPNGAVPLAGGAASRL